MLFRSGGKSYSYDAEGNLTSDGTSGYAWNERNQLASISNGASEIATDHINVWRQISRVRVAGERADSHPSGRQLRQNLAAYVAGSSNDQNSIYGTILPATGASRQQTGRDDKLP